MATATNFVRPNPYVLYGVTHRLNGRRIRARQGGLRPVPGGGVGFTIANAICANCGDVFLAMQRDVNKLLSGKYKNLFCTPECASLFRLSTAPRMEDHPMWRGGRVIHNGYVHVLKPGYPSANRSGYVREHVLIAETALGKALPKGCQIHHFNENKQDNRNCNLVICEDAAYHQLLHARQRILNAGGNPNRDKICCTCKKVRLKTDFHGHRRSWDGYNEVCKPCRSLNNKAKRILGEPV